jgi:membrane protease YdiL (CAAX protease family)
MTKLAPPIAAMLASAASLFLGFWVLRSAAWGFALYYLVCCLGIPFFDLVLKRGLPPRRLPGALGFGKPRGRELALGLGSGAAMVAIMLVALVLLRDRVFGSGEVEAALSSWGVPREYLALLCAVMLALNGAAEEFFWRGYLHERLAFLSKRYLAVGLSTFFFGAQHLFVISSIVRDPAVVSLFLFGITGAGAIWGYMRERSGSLVPCVLSHMMVTAGYLGIFLYYSSAA